jgi:ribosome-binding protein aMBF1 (putative translation factor)
MIQNQRQYKVTKGQISNLTRALEAARKASGKMDPRVVRAMVAGIHSQIEELREQVQEYEKLAEAASLSLRSAEDLPQLLIKARVARGYTQKDLAEKVNVKAQLIQKYEATNYRSASFKRVLAIIKALHLDLHADISLRTTRTGLKEHAPQTP